jgi:hypothetical protein
MRVWLGFGISPLVLPILNMLWLMLIDHVGGAALSVTVLILAISYAVMFWIGVPTYFALRTTKLSGLPVYLAWGVLLGLVGQLLFAWVLGYDAISDWVSYFHAPTRQLTEHTYIVATQIWIFGVVAALVFWLIARPDKLTAIKHAT